MRSLLPLHARTLPRRTCAHAPRSGRALLALAFSRFRRIGVDARGKIALKD